MILNENLVRSSYLNEDFIKKYEMKTKTNQNW